MNEEIIFSVEVDTEEAKRNTVELTKLLKALREQKAENAKAQKELKKAFDAGSISAAEYESSLDGLIKSELKLEAQIKDTNSELKTAKKIQDTNANSLAALRLENAKLTKQVNNLNTATEEGQAEFQRLTAQIRENKEAISEAEQSMGNFTGQVGNYKNAIMDAISQNADMFGGMKDMGGGMGDLAGKFAMAAGPIGALVAVVGLLFTAFSKTSGGAVKMEQVMGGLSSVFNSAMGALGNFVGSIGKMDFSFKNIGDTIAKFFQNRLDGMIESVGLLGQAFGALVTGDFAKLEELAPKIADSGLKAITGLENVATKTSEFIGNAYTEGENLVKMQQAAALSTRALEIETNKLAAQYERLTTIADDDTISFKERRAAQLQALETSEKLGEAELKLAKIKMGVNAQEIAMRKRQGLDYRDLIEAQTQAIIEVDTKEAELIQRRTERAGIIRKMEMDDMETRLDILMDSADATKAAIEREIAYTGGSVEQRLALLEKLKSGTIKSKEDLQKAQEEIDSAGENTLEQRKKRAVEMQKVFETANKAFLSEIEKNTGKAIDFENVFAEKNAVKQEAMIREMGLSEIHSTRFLELIKERTAAEQDYVDAKNSLLDEEIGYATKSAEKEVAIEAKKDADLKALLQIRAENDKEGADARLALLDYELEAELEKYKGNAEMQAEITKKYEAAKVAIVVASNEEKAASTAQMLGEAASLFEENTIAYKVLASAQALTNTYLAATSAYAAAAKIDPFILAPIAAGLAVASGLASVAKINAIEFADGGMLQGNSHAKGGIKGMTKSGLFFEAEGGEFITNKRATANNMDALATINANPNMNFTAVPTFEFGGQIPFETKVMAEMQSPQAPIYLRVTDLHKVENTVAVTQKIANF
jgi:hypothetical protein